MEKQRIAMNKSSEEEKAYPIWIDHTDKIVSFQSAEGFERLLFPSQEGKLAFAMEKCCSGYRVQ